MSRYKTCIEEILNKANIPKGTLDVHDGRFYSRVYKEGSIGLGEAYMEGWFDTTIPLEEFFAKLTCAHPRTFIKKLSPLLLLRLWLWALYAQVFDLQNSGRSQNVAEHHYNLDRKLYEPMLGPTMQYTCSYRGRGANTLDSAQNDKLDLICDKLELKNGDRVLELGCGWGTLAEHMAKKYGCDVTAYNLSKEQIVYARNRTKRLPIKFVEADYRDALVLEKEKFDHVVSIGMLEHVGPHNYKKFITLGKKLLKPDGLFLIHSIGGHAANPVGDPWSDKYIFPGGVIPSWAKLGKAIDGQFRILDWHNFGNDYYQTLLWWNENAQKAFPELVSSGKYDERFVRMWTYYLLSFAGLFKSGHLDLWQLVLSNGGREGYKKIR